MPLVASNPQMSHSPAYCHNRAIISTAPLDDYGALSSRLQQPPPAHIHHQRHGLPPVTASPTSHQSSESSRSPKPAAVIAPKYGDAGKNSLQSTSPHTFSFSSNAEEGSVNHGPNRSTKHYSGRYGTIPSQTSYRADRNSAEYNTAIYTYTPEGGGVERITDHAVLVLLWLACFDPFYSLFSALYTIFAVFTLFIFTPFRLCISSSSFEVLAIRALAPVLRLHLRLMYAESARDADEFEFKVGRIIAVQVVSPVVSIGVAFAEWVAAPFWIFAIIIGNPDGTERRDDGKATVLAIRNWWEQCLLRAAIR